MKQATSLETSEDSGKQPIMKGDLLLTSKPFAYVLKSELKGQYCDNCLRKKNGAQRCSGCALTYYCSRDCQKTGWELHKKECSKLRKLKPVIPPDTARLMARVIFRLQDDGYDYEEKVDDNKSRKFSDLMDHYSDVKEDPFRQEHFTSLVVVLNKYLGEENLPTGEELLAIYGRVLVNTYSITDRDLDVVGLGVYLAGSIVDHSCRPNAYASFIGPNLVMRSMYDMPDFDWQKVRISYIDVLNSTKDRVEELKKGYFFTCDCNHCSDTSRDKVMSSTNCGNTDCTYPIYIDEHEDATTKIDPCPKCGFEEFENGTREKYCELAQLTRTKLSEMKRKNYFDMIKFLVEKQGSLFHPLHLLRVKVLDAAFECSINAQSWEEAVSYGCQNLGGIKFLYGSNHPMYALCLLKLGKIELYLFKLQEALNHLEEAEPILKVSHGVTHPLYADDLSHLLKQARQEIKMMQYNGFKVMHSNNGGNRNTTALLS